MVSDGAPRGHTHQPGHRGRPGPDLGPEQAATVKHEGHACVSPGFHPKAHLGAAFLSLRRERRRPEEGEGRAAPHLSLPGAGTRGRRGWQGRPDTGRATRAPQHGRHTHLSGSCPALQGNGRESAGGRPSTLSGTLGKTEAQVRCSPPAQRLRQRGPRSQHSSCNFRPSVGV